MKKRIALLSCISIFLLSTILSVYTIAFAFGTEEITEPEYVEIADYYDNRTAVVTVTADDWYRGTWSWFEDMSRMLTSKHLYYTGGIITHYSVNWTQIQYWLDQGYAEAASHSRTHPSTVPYSDYDSEIGGSKQDIITNLVLPSNFSYDSSEYVYSWIEPFATTDDTIRQKLGEYRYLADRRVSIDDGWAPWDSANGLFSRIGFSTRMDSGYETDVEALNSKFDIVYNAGEIYHLMFHPRDVNWQPGEYADLHTSYISNREDVWYVSFGLLYLYHWVDTQNVVQVTSTGALKDKTFKVNMSSTDRQFYGAKYPVTYVFDIPSGWTDAYVNYRFRTADSWTTLETKTSSDFFNGINAVRFDYSSHRAYVSIGFSDVSNEIFLQILPKNDQPIADFTASPTSGNAPLDVSFTENAISYDGIINREWDFNGDNVTDSTEPNPTYRYDQPGLYTVSLTVYDADGDNDTKTKIDYVDVNHPPIADESGPYTEKEGVAIAFNSSSSYDPDGTIVSYFWDFGDGQTSTEQNPTYTYLQNGTYTVSLTVTDNWSATDTDTTAATVDDTSPTADFSANATSGREPLTVAFNASSSTGYDQPLSYTWDFGDGAYGEGVNPTHIYTQNKDFLVTLTVVDNDGSTGSTTQTITVIDTPPVADFTASPTYGSEPLTVNFTDASTSHDGITSWNWTFGDGETSTEQNPIHTYTSAGLYTVSLTVSEADGDNHTETKFPYIIVDDSVPTASFTHSPSNPLEGNLITFDASGSKGYDQPLSYSWNFNDGTLLANSTDPTATHIYTQDGNYIVTLTVVDNDGSTDSTSHKITVTSKAPVADFTASPTSELEPLTISFTDNSSSYDRIIAWAWDFNNDDVVDSTEQNPTHKFPDNGIFNVTLTVTDTDGYKASVTKPITIQNTPPTADFNSTSSPKPTINEDITFTDQSSDPDGTIIMWLWDLGDGTTSTSQNITHRYYALGTFIVNLTVTDDDGETDTVSKSITIYDVVPPVTVDDYDGLPRTSDFAINLTATDDLSGVQAVYYKINDSPVMDIETHGQPHISTEGYNQLEYWAVDSYGNEETHHVISNIKLDKTSNAGATWRLIEATIVIVGTSAAGTIIWLRMDKKHTLRKNKKKI